MTRMVVLEYPPNSRVNLGCGKDIREGWINCDKYPGPGVDMVFDLEDGLPFEDNTIWRIEAAHVLEHIVDWADVVNECFRVLIPGGFLIIRVPYGLDGNPFHKRVFLPHSLDFWIGVDDGRSFEVDRLPQFDLVSMDINRKLWHAWHFQKYLRIPVINKRIGRPVEIVWVLRKMRLYGRG